MKGDCTPGHVLDKISDFASKRCTASVTTLALTRRGKGGGLLSAGSVECGAEIGSSLLVRCRGECTFIKGTHWAIMGTRWRLHTKNGKKVGRVER